jgi:glycosyltransferase involved in cell wall biosynthesis
VKQTIVFVLENFYPDYRAGTESYVLNLAKGLLRNGWKVSIIVAAVGKESQKYFFDQIQVNALSVPSKISVAQLNGLKEPSNLKEFKELLGQEQPQIVHFHSFSRSFTHQHLKVAHNMGAKVFFTAHLGGIFCARGDLQLFGKKLCNAHIGRFRCAACFASQKSGLLKSYIGASASLIKLSVKKYPALNMLTNKLQSMHYLAKFVHQNIAIAQWIEKAFHVNGIANTTLLTQAIDTSKFEAKPKTEKSQKIQLGFVGRMNPSKGFYLLLDALKGLEKQYELHCITIRDASEPEYYVLMKNKFLALGYMHWQEQVSHEEISKLMNVWDLFCLPSKHEVAPLSILESFSKGIPVVGSDYPAIAEMIADGLNGLLFKNKDATDLADKLRTIAENREIIAHWQQNMAKVKDISLLVKEHEEIYHRQYL